jgi:hypothetical protein
MPSRARIIPRFNSSGRPVSVPGATYTFHNPQAELDARGARELDTDYHDALRQEQHAASERYQQMHAELELAKLRREEVHDMEKAQRRIKYEAMMEKAIPELYAIDPADPQATQKHAAFAERWPQLLHSDPGYPSIMQEFHQHIGMSQESAKQRDAITARKEAKEAADQAKADVREEKRLDFERQQKMLTDLGARPKSVTVGGMTFDMPESVEAKDAAKQEVLKEKQDAEKSKKTEAAQKRFDDAHSKYTGALDTLSGADKDNPVTPGFYAQKNVHKQEMQAAADRLKALDPSAATEVDKKLKDLSLAEHNVLQSQLGEIAGLKLTDDLKKKRDLLIGQLNPIKKELGYDLIDPEDPTKTIANPNKGAASAAAAASPGAIDTAQTDTPAVRDTAPVSGGTATPSGDMVPLTGAAAPAPPAATTTATGEDAVPNLSRAPAAVAPPAVPTGEDVVPNLSAVAPAPPATPMPPPAVAAPVHPMEGKRVKHKETGQGGTIVNGEFVPDETEALQDQPAA